MKPIPRSPIAGTAQINPEWVRWFNELVTAVDEIRKEPYRVHTAGVTLTTADLGLVHIFNTGATNIEVTLPSVDTSNLHSWVKIVRLGTGKARLLIRASDSDLIEYSSAPGRIWCNEDKRTAANITLQLVQATKWAIMAGTGIWKTA